MEKVTTQRVRASHAKSRRVRPRVQRRAAKPFDVWILEKIWLKPEDVVERSDCFAFDSFRAANRAMFDDWTEEYKDRPDAPDEGDETEFREDQFWCQQTRPFDDDEESRIDFRDGSAIQWNIYNRSVESLSPLWDKEA